MDEDSALDKDGDNAAAESEDELVFETIPQSPMTNQSKSKSRKVIIFDALMSSDSEGKHWHIHASPTLLSVGGHTKYFRRNSKQSQSIASKKLTASKGSAGGLGRK
jgi:hypothetical protein